MEQKIEDYPDLRKVDKSYVVNVNQQQYNAARARVKTSRRFNEMEQRLTTIEQSLSTIITILQNRGNNNDGHPTNSTV